MPPAKKLVRKTTPETTIDGYWDKEILKKAHKPSKLHPPKPTMITWSIPFPKPKFHHQITKITDDPIGNSKPATFDSSDISDPQT